MTLHRPLLQSGTSAHLLKAMQSFTFFKIHFCNFLHPTYQTLLHSIPNSTQICLNLHYGSQVLNVFLKNSNNLTKSFPKKQQQQQQPMPSTDSKSNLKIQNLTRGKNLHVSHFEMKNYVQYLLSSDGLYINLHRPNYFVKM